MGPDTKKTIKAITVGKCTTCSGNSILLTTNALAAFAALALGLALYSQLHLEVVLMLLQTQILTTHLVLSAGLSSKAGARTWDTGAYLLRPFNVILDGTNGSSSVSVRSELLRRTLISKSFTGQRCTRTFLKQSHTVKRSNPCGKMILSCSSLVLTSLVFRTGLPHHCSDLRLVFS